MRVGGVLSVASDHWRRGPGEVEGSHNYRLSLSLTPNYEYGSSSSPPSTGGRRSSAFTKVMQGETFVDQRHANSRKVVE